MSASVNQELPVASDTGKGDMTWGFHPSIDLFDETLREEAERAPISASIEAKCKLAGAIADAGIRTIVTGMLPDVPHNIALLTALLDEQERGGHLLDHLSALSRETLMVM